MKNLPDVTKVHVVVVTVQVTDHPVLLLLLGRVRVIQSYSPI